MNKQFQTAYSVVASMASYILRQLAFAWALLLLPFLAHAQVADLTSIERIGTTNVYNLVFHQGDDPISLAGVEYYVVVEGSSPSITLSVPSGGTWLFDECYTTLNVGSPVILDEVYKFPIYAWREDNEPQDGDGLYLRVTVTNGIAITVDDFPTKAPSSIGYDLPTATSLQAVWEQATSVAVCSLDGRQLITLHAPNLPDQAATLWRSLQTGAYIIDATMADNRHVRLKVVR